MRYRPQPHCQPTEDTVSTEDQSNQSNHSLDSLQDVDVEVSSKAAGVVVEDRLGISKTLQNGKNLCGLEEDEKKVVQQHDALQLPDSTTSRNKSTFF